MSSSNRQIITVAELNRDAKRLLESEFPLLYVEGEISNLAQPGSGHWYFTLKDDKAQVRCAMFRNRNQMVRFKPRNGQQIVVRGRISLYEGRGEFQMIADFLEDSGDGALRRAFENLKRSLQQEGLFDDARKRALPPLASHVAIVTSPAGAAIRDVIAVMRRRFPAINIGIFPVQVQGEESVDQIVEALATVNRHQQQFDLILLTRGGGSLEDLWSFNTEPVARAIAASELPVVCAVGHESDVSIADFVADLRAPTPSAAAELITPDASVLLDSAEYMEKRLLRAMQQHLSRGLEATGHLSRRLRHPSSRLQELAQKTDELERRLTAAAGRILERKHSSLNRLRLTSPTTIIQSAQLRLAGLNEKLERRGNQTLTEAGQKLSQLASKLQTLSPLATLERGYAIVTDDSDQRVLTDATDIEPGSKIRARLQSGQVVAEVLQTEIEKNPTIK